MKAIIINQYGDKENLKMSDIPKPECQSDEILIKMHATSINPIDWKLRYGYLKEMLPMEFPIVLGWDGAGVVDEVGSSLTSFKKGDRVFVRPETTNRGTYTEFIACKDKLAAKIPNNISFEEAAGVPLAGLTAYQCLVTIGNMKKNDKVLIHAGAGGVGSLAIQIAKHFGAFVATTGSAKNHELLKTLGADVIIDYNTEDFEEIIKDYDLVVDSIGGTIQEKSLHTLKKGGKLVSIVQPPDEKKANELGVSAVFHWLIPNGKELKILADMMESGALKVIIDTVFPFTEQGLKDAHELSESHHAKGKIIIKIN